MYYFSMASLLVSLLLSSCSTSFLEMQGECVLQQWQFFGSNVRTRMICDLPSPELTEIQVRDREAMDTNPFPGAFDRNNADSVDPDLLEKHTGRKPDEGEEE